MEASGGAQIKMAGFVSDAAHMMTKKGVPFGKFVLNDYTGHTEIVLFNDNYAKWKDYLQNGQKLVVHGAYREHPFRPGVMELNVSNISLLEKARGAMTKCFNVGLPLKKLTDETAAFLVENLKSNPGATEMVVHVLTDDPAHQLSLRTNGHKISVNDALLEFLEGKGVRYRVELC